MIRQRKKVLESETLQETDKHSAFCTSPSKLAFGECSEVSKLQKQRHVKEWVRPLLRFVSDREWRLVDRRAVCHLIFQCPKLRTSPKHLDTTLGSFVHEIP